MAIQPTPVPAYISCYNCTVDDIHGETVGEFANVIARYRTTHQKLFNEYAKGNLNSSPYPNTGITVASDFEDARSCWFPIDSIKKFICLMERYSATLGFSPANLGIRFYYGVYWSQYEKETSFSNRHTLYLTATLRKNGTADNVDFDPKMSADSGVVVPLSALIRDQYKNTTIFSIDAGSSAAYLTSRAVTMNQGDLCPPRTGCNPTIKAIDIWKPAVPLNNTSN